MNKSPKEAAQGGIATSPPAGNGAGGVNPARVAEFSFSTWLHVQCYAEDCQRWWAMEDVDVERDIYGCPYCRNIVIVKLATTKRG